MTSVDSTVDNDNGTPHRVICEHIAIYSAAENKKV